MPTANRKTAEQVAAHRLSQWVKPRIPLSHRAFAERYIVMPPSGPRGRQRFKVEWQPFVGLLWDEFDSGHWQTAAITGVVQSSKSFSGLVVPTLRDAIELRLDPIVGVPEADMFADKWDKDFKPVLEASDELRRLLPDSGPGSKGGRVKDRITLGSGEFKVDIKVMSRGGQATNKAGYTSPRLHITEAAGFSEASGADKNEEADPYRQLLGRLGAFKRSDKRRFVTVEGTVTVAEQLPWRLRGEDDDALLSSRSRILAPCPHCEAWISPEREHLIGWQDATSEQQVVDNARFVCPVCAGVIDDRQRAVCAQDYRIVHWGQEITPAGEVIGPRPPTFTLWFRWSAWHNLLLDAADTAVKEWEAAQIEDGTIDRENAERDLCQKNWAIPYRPKLDENEPLNPKLIRKRTATAPGWQRGIIPADTKALAMGLDIGEWTSWWWLLAFTNSGELHTPAYGAFDVKRSKEEDAVSRLLHALQQFNETVVLPGFPIEGSAEMWIPDAVGVDIGHLPDTVAEAMRTFGSGIKNRWKGTRGRGKSVNRPNNGSYHHPARISSAIPKIGTQWYMEPNFKRRIFEITFNADYWLKRLQEYLRPKVGRKASLTFFRSDTPNEHAKASHHLAAEKWKKERDKKTGQVVEKYVVNGDNHLSDAAKIALIMLDYLGCKMQDVPVQSASSALEESPESSGNWYLRMLSA